ncbi:MAG: hypothetical protein ABI740_09020, partial [Alphaproteobacteria bacterium]
MDVSAELDVETVLEALEALNDGIAIYGPDNRQIYVNGIAMSRFGQYYDDLANLGPWVALFNSIRRSNPEMSEPDLSVATDEYTRKFVNNQTYTSTTENGRHVVISFRPMTNGRKAGISVDVTDLHNREIELGAAKK